MVNDKLNYIIPNDWEVRHLDDFGQIVSGGTPSTAVSEYWNGPIAWCTPTDITRTDGITISETEKSITDAGLKNSAAVVLPTGSLLLCTRATIGDSKINNIPMATNQGFKNIIPYKETCIKYLYYLLQTKKKEMLEKATASTFAEISKSALCEIALQTPKRTEQEKIAEVLSDIDILIENLKKLITKKKNIRQGTMQILVTGKKRLKEFSGDWKVTSLDKLCRIVTKQTGFDYSAEIKPSLVTAPQIGTIPFIQNKDFEGFEINYNTDFFIPYDVAEKYPKILLDEVCLLISISGRIGNVAVFDHKQTAFAGGAVGIAKLYDPEIAKWCMLYLSCKEGQEQIFSNEKVGAQHNLTVADVRKLEIKLPEKPEREAIINVLLDMDNEIRLLEEKLQKYVKMKQGMMEELLTGKVRLI